MKRLTRIGISFIIASLTCLYTQLAAAISVQQSSFDSETIVQPSEQIRFVLDRLPTPEEGQLAIFIGRTDVTSQFQIVGTEFIYQSSIFPLPTGRSQITVYLVSGNEWQEIAQLPIHVSTQRSSPEVSTELSPVPSESTQPVTEPDAQPSIESAPTEAERSIESELTEEGQSTQSQSSEPTDVSEPEQPNVEKPEQAEPEQVEPETTSAELANTEPVTSTSDFSFSFKPRVNTTIKSQFREERSQDAGVAERPTFTDATVESGFESELKWGEFTLQSRASFLGVTFQPEALRFGELQETAPKFDLSEYQLDAIWGPLQFSMGHQCYGNHPFLLDNFCSRGMTLKAKLSDRVDVSVNSMSATSIVGFSNLSGLNDFDNNITAATLGIQLVNNDAGGIRLEATMMSGDRKPVGNFNEGEVIDAEKNRGFGLRLFGSDNSGRLRFDVGYARSRFTNPPDPQLTGGEEIEEPPIDEVVEEPIEEVPDEEAPIEEAPIKEVPDGENPVEEAPIEEVPDGESPIEEGELTNDGDGSNPVDENSEAPIEDVSDEVPDEESPIEEGEVEDPTREEPIDEGNEEEIEVIPVEPVTREAIYAEVSYDLLKEVKIGSNHTLSLTLNARHERIDPQFQTLGASVEADKLRNLVGFNATVAGATIQFQHEWFEDNLANVPTILKTKTRNTSLNVNVPLQTVLESQSQFLPTLNYSYQRVHQFGANVPIPELSGFDETEIPDQLNVQHQLGAQWSFDNLSLSYQFSSSSQDNRQPSRENADFHNLTHQVSLSWQPSPQFQLSVGYNWSSAKSIEEGITRFSASPTIGFSWEFSKGATLAVNFSRNDNFDSLDQSFTRGDGLEAVLTWNFNVNTGIGLQLPVSAFIRYSRQSTINRDNVFDLSNDSTIEIINGGLSFSF